MTATVKLDEEISASKATSSINPLVLNLGHSSNSATVMATAAANLPTLPTSCSNNDPAVIFERFDVTIIIK